MWAEYQRFVSRMSMASLGEHRIASQIATAVPTSPIPPTSTGGNHTFVLRRDTFDAQVFRRRMAFVAKQWAEAASQFQRFETYACRATKMLISEKFSGAPPNLPLDKLRLFSLLPKGTS
jgi:hypothetical protein